MPWPTGEARESRGERVLLGLAAIGVFFLWMKVYSPVFRVGFFADDAYYLSVSPPSLHDFADWFLVPADDNGYYRPVSRVLWSWSSAAGARAPGTFQLITLVFLFGAAALLFYGLRALLANAWLALGAAATFTFSLVHTKSLFWITLWFNTASAFFAAGTFTFFLLHGREERPWQRRAGLVFLGLAYATNNGMHSLALLPVAIDWVFLPPAEERAFAKIQRLLCRARDHLLLSLSFFSFVYLYGAPFGRSGIHPHPLEMATLSAFGKYLLSTIGHNGGDGPPDLANMPALAWLALGVVLLSTCFGFLWNRRFLLISALVLGTAFVFSLLHDRWQVEYAAPLALGTSAALACFFAVLLEYVPVGKRALSFAIAAGMIAAYARAGVANFPRFAAQYLRAGGETMAFVRSVQDLDRETPPGKVLHFAAMESPALKDAPFALFVISGLWRFIPGRAYVFGAGIFHSGQYGMENEEAPIEKIPFLSAKPFVEISCGPEGCRRMGDP